MGGKEGEGLYAERAQTKGPATNLVTTHPPSKRNLQAMTLHSRTHGAKYKGKSIV